MELLREILTWPHVILGFTGLVAFWFPVFARKGATLHRRAGKIFVWCGYGVTFSAALSCAVLATIILGRDLTEHNRENLASIAFLAYLALVTFVVLRHSMRVLESKRRPSRIDTPLDRGLAYAAITASLAIIAFALAQPTGKTVLLLALSPIGLTSGWGIRRYLTGADPSPRAWFYEHMGATLGAGIAFHTAFAVFGMRRIFELPSSGLLSMLPWILPAAIGIPGTFLWQRYYRNKFGDLPAKSAAPEARPPAPRETKPLPQSP